jgi:hypothetical protein
MPNAARSGLPLYAVASKIRKHAAALALTLAHTAISTNIKGAALDTFLVFM